MTSEATTSVHQFQQVSYVSPKSYEKVIAAIDAEINGSIDLEAYRKALSSLVPGSGKEFIHLIETSVGPAGLMLLGKYELGKLVKHVNPNGARGVRYLVGNPTFMVRALQDLPEVGLYAPVTIFIDERADGVHITYNTIESTLAPYHREEASKVANEIDKKVLSVIQKAAN